jgi:GTP-binding protein Era
MNERMMSSVRTAIEDADVVVLVVDSTAPFGRGDEFTIELLKGAKTRKVLLLNKIDLIPKKDLLPIIDRYSRAVEFDEIIPVSALTGEQVETFVDAVIKYLPEGPMFYPGDQISDQHERSIAAELVREKVILFTEQELPYSTAVVIDRFEEGEKLHRIHASIYVDRDSQKGIVIGKQGARLKEIGAAARQDLEAFFGRRVFLELHVKVEKHWRDSDEKLRAIGLGD